MAMKEQNSRTFFLIGMTNFQLCFWTERKLADICFYMFLSFKNLFLSSAEQPSLALRKLSWSGELLLRAVHEYRMKVVVHGWTFPRLLLFEGNFLYLGVDVL